MTQDLKEMVKKILELDANRTKGEWFWSARTLRSEIRDEEEDIEEIPDILHVDSDKCIYSKEADAKFILYAPEMAELIKELTERESKLVEALKWYASVEKDGIPINDDEDINDDLDIGRTARQTLDELGIKQ